MTNGRCSATAAPFRPPAEAPKEKWSGWRHAVLCSGHTYIKIPPRIEKALSDAVARQLEAELGSRGLLLASGELAAAAADAEEHGGRLLVWVIRRCYPIDRQDDRALTFEFRSDVARIEAALAFGAVTARLLAPSGRHDTATFADSVEPICALFNLGIGLVDGLCDHDAEAGAVLLDLMRAAEMRTAAEEPHVRGWLRAKVPPGLLDNPSVAFTADVIETFFETLHDRYAADLHLRRRVGALLGVALEAERRSVSRSADQSVREELMECSRLTSVLPFQIIETLAGADSATVASSQGTQLGEAMWRIDDLIDLIDDARGGALNGVLLGAATSIGRPQAADVLAALERLLASADITYAAREAAEKLQAGLRLNSATGRLREARARAACFLYFTQGYAGIGPRPPS